METTQMSLLKRKWLTKWRQRIGYGVSALVELHRKRVANGERSVLVGLQSFAEGLDLKGDLHQSRKRGVTQTVRFD